MGRNAGPLGGLFAVLFRRWRRGSPAGAREAGDAAAAIRSMKWQEFELLVGEGFRLRGFLVTERGEAGADGGLDLVLQRGHEQFVAQCRHWRAAKVDVAAVRELNGVVAATGAAGGFVVTSGDFTADAAQLARGCNIRVINGAELAAMLERARQTLTMPPRIEPRLGEGSPACPRCGRAMVQRVAMQGSNAGKPFWGCPAFPECRGTLPIG